MNHKLIPDYAIEAKVAEEIYYSGSPRNCGALCGLCGSSNPITTADFHTVILQSLHEEE